jgi:predicted metal-dependent phosphoesterase TrpH
VEEYIDLHTHTIASDGGLSVVELIKKAKEANLKALGITDHDSVDSLDVGLKEGERVGLEVVPGCEFSCYDQEKEFHILGYYLDYHKASFQKKLRYFQWKREERAKAIIKNLNSCGFQIDYEEVRGLAFGSIVLPHIAEAVIRNKSNEVKLVADFGLVPSVGNFIGRYLTKDGVAYVTKEGFDVKEAIETIHSLGGVAVLAHPAWDLVTVENESLVFNQDFYLKKLKRFGLDGLEVLTYRVSDDQTRTCVTHFTDQARNLDLIVTGGSDYHGCGGIGKELGLENVYLKIPYSCLESLKRRRNEQLHFLSNCKKRSAGGCSL